MYELVYQKRNRLDDYKHEKLEVLEKESIMTLVFTLLCTQQKEIIYLTKKP